MAAIIKDFSSNNQPKCEQYCTINGNSGLLFGTKKVERPTSVLQAQETSVSARRHAQAPAREPKQKAQKEQGAGYFIDSPLGLTAERLKVRTMLSASDFREMPFQKAAEEWLKSKEIRNSAKTLKSYRDYLTRLGKAFNGLVLKEIHIGHLEEYQRQNKAKYHPTAVNHDLNMLSQILRRAELWTPIEEHYRPVKVPKWQPPKVLTEEQEAAFFRFAASRPEWALAYWVASLTNNTTASGIELRLVRRQNVVLEEEPPIFYVPDGKNEYRPRAIPLNEVGVKQMRRVLDRASSLGSTQPGHYVFPFRVKRNFYDPTRPASESWLKKRWKKLVDAAMAARIIPFRIKPHNLRHQIITKLLENGTPENTVMAIAGHVRREMLEHYSHTRIAAKSAALAALVPGRKKASA